jgi:heme A synthase
MRPVRVTANLVGMMIFVQVILGGSAVLLGLDIVYHIVWGTLTFIVLLVTAGLAVRAYGSRSTLFRVAIAAVADFIIQILLGFSAFDSDVLVVVHLTNAFVLAVLVTYLISFADNAEKARMPSMSMAAS